MKQGIIYGGIFLLTFVLVSGAIIYLNTVFVNIFQFDFTPKSSVVNTEQQKSTDSLYTETKEELTSKIDSTSERQDSVLLSSTENENDIIKNTTTDTSNTIKNEVKNVSQQPMPTSLVKSDENRNALTEQNSLKPDDTKNEMTNIDPEKQKLAQSQEYLDWVKKVSKIYASMEPRKAAKIIQNYSDNMARDILYNMNKKIAAKVVSEFSPETAQRIFRFE